MTRSILSNKDKIWHRQGKDSGVGAAVSAKMAKERYALTRSVGVLRSREAAQFSIRRAAQQYLLIDVGLPGAGVDVTQLRSLLL